nr:hypothetical protein [Oscillospiraceae bacterium]
MKKRIFAMAVIAICLAILAYGTTAYYTVEETAHNVISSGAVDVEVVEWQKTPTGLEEYPTQPITIMPATQVSKIVTVKNIDAESFVRAKYHLVVKDSAGRVKEIPASQLDKIIDVTLTTDGWTRKDGDGEWWYYEKPLKAGETTETLITGVSFDGPNMTNEYQNCTVEVVVTAQGVQTAHNKETVLEAVGWPEE